MSRPRKFDHDEARRLFAGGATVAAIAAHHSVSWSAVARVVDPDFRTRSDERSRIWMRDHYRKPCACGCGRLVWMGTGRSGLCCRCHGAARATTVRPTGLLCNRCREWKPDESFPHSRANLARRGRHSTCRACQAPARQESRLLHAHPCVACGRPRIGDLGRRGRDTGLCFVCYRARMRTHKSGFLCLLQSRSPARGMSRLGVLARAVLRKVGGQ